MPNLSQSVDVTLAYKNKQYIDQAAIIAVKASK
jgi:hypothetical protein